jgi:nucleoside-diphosphate-sugar epimerase
MRVLLTGATGLLGSHLVEQILAKGWFLTVLVRAIPQRSFLGQLRKDEISTNLFSDRLQIQEGSLESHNISEHFDVVIHNAAKVSAEASEADLVWKTNFEGTQQLYRSLEGKFKKWVQISSIATLCDGQADIVDELYIGSARKTPYAESKLAAGKWLEAQNKDTLLIHPCYMLGRWDSKPSSGVIFHAVRFGKIHSYAEATKNFIAASDVAKGIIQGIDLNSQGNYILGNENISLTKFFMELTRVLNVPNSLVIEELSNESTDFTKEFCMTSAVDCSKARQELNFFPNVHLVQMLEETMEYFERFKMLKRVQKR